MHSKILNVCQKSNYYLVLVEIIPFYCYCFQDLVQGFIVFLLCRSLGEGDLRAPLSVDLSTVLFNTVSANSFG